MFKRHPRSTLYRSLEKALTHPSSASSAWMENHDSDFLRLRASPNDNSLYWVDKDDHVLSLAFPAILDPEKTYNEIESYNVLNDMKVSSSSSLRISKTVFILTPLTNVEDHDIPKRAIECSMMALTILQSLYHVVEEKLQNHPALSSHVTSSSFLEARNRSHKSFFVVRTPRLLEGVFCPKPDTMSPSPFERHECLISQSHSDSVLIVSLKDFKRPPYYNDSNLVERQQQSIPNIRDADGSLLQPSEYRSKIQNKTIVIVNVHFKIEVSEDSSRNYQMIVNSMQILPISNSPFVLH